MVQARRTSDGVTHKAYSRGFPVGFKAVEKDSKVEKFFLHNHLRFTILHSYDAASDTSRIVGFEVEPFSVKHKTDWSGGGSLPMLDTCNPGRVDFVTHEMWPQAVEEGAEVVFSYDVRFVSSDVRWVNRWDLYLHMYDDDIHWFSIVNSMLIVLFLSAMVAVILLRALARDISKYNQLDAEMSAEESGWKLVHGDVFRPPPGASLLATHVGTGVQIFSMVVATMVFALCGFLSPANRGALMTAMLVMFVFMGALGGYQAAALYKAMQGEEWKAMTLRTAMLFPGVAFLGFFLLNLLAWHQGSSIAVPFGTLFALCVLWFGISVPLVFVGSHFGYRQPPRDNPVRTNKIPRQVPEQPWYLHPAVVCAIGGILPFGAIFIELFFILTSFWMQQFYYLFGFLALVFVILIITCAEIAIVLVYFQLCSEDYNWWWRAFFTSGASAAYLLLYSVFYFFTKLPITKAVPALMYLMYMAVTAYGFFCLTGAIGFYACYAFVHTIYGSVKID